MSTQYSKTGQVLATTLQLFRVALRYSTICLWIEQLRVILSSAAASSRFIALVELILERGKYLSGAPSEMLATLTIPVRESIILRIAVTVPVGVAAHIAERWQVAKANSTTLSSSDIVLARPIKLLSTTVLIAVFVNIALILLTGTQKIDTYAYRILLVGLALLGTRVRLTWSDIVNYCYILDW